MAPHIERGAWAQVAVKATVDDFGEAPHRMLQLAFRKTLTVLNGTEGLLRGLMRLSE